MGTLTNSEDPDVMQHNAAFHQGLHCLLRAKQFSGTGIYHSSVTPKSTQWVVPCLLYQYVWKNWVKTV